MSKHSVKNAKTIFIDTGNLLSIHDITKKPGQNPTEEVSLYAICHSKRFDFY